jgi:hypothetical protein
MVDVLVALGLLRAGHDLLQTLEDVEQDRQCLLALSGVQCAAEFRVLSGRHDIGDAQALEQIVVVELVLSPDQPPELEQQHDLFAVARPPRL